ncbi:hypothetical protein O181_089825 [Austropuccinia psidii MF-1]|uniref:Reverse transcriptase domain-containing protein n=1 Tax=Austropuccinia psidii MF-1 TaxID=1389203 RepID=A0A9Q3IU15_9BASI|nr:hypothetical protein [Austropuccinia psidii MF-1]
MDNQILAAKYRSVLKKVRPVNEPMPQELNPPLSTDSYETPLSPSSSISQETFKVTHERLQEIPVIPHEPWQKKLISIPKLILSHFTELIRERIRTVIYEQSTSSYTSPIFCVAKSNGRLRIVHDLQELDKVTIKEACLPPQIEEFVNSFSGRSCYGLGDMMGGYDERELDVTTRPLTTFETPLGRM